MCQIADSAWERIGYAVTEVLDEFHEAMSRGKIISVSFDTLYFSLNQAGMLEYKLQGVVNGHQLFSVVMLLVTTFDNFYNYYFNCNESWYCSRYSIRVIK